MRSFNILPCNRYKKHIAGCYQVTFFRPLSVQCVCWKVCGRNRKLGIAFMIKNKISCAMMNLCVCDGIQKTDRPVIEALSDLSPTMNSDKTQL